MGDRRSTATSVAPTVEVLLDADAWARDIAETTRAGLTDLPPWVPPLWFYDEVGSKLFDEITRLPEYYPTRAEAAVLAARADEVAERSGADTLIELGSGTSEKTRLLLDALDLDRFVPFDCSEEVLREAAVAVAGEHPGLAVHAVVGDFHRHLDALPRGGRRLLAFLGSTIGNLDVTERAGFLAEVGSALGPDDAFLLGTDLVKDPARLEAAYDDASGVTAAFNRNALAVMNERLGADFAVEQFEHAAVWDDAERRIEMRLVARAAQRVRIRALDLTVAFDPGEWLRTEISTKFTLDGVAGELAAAGMAVAAQWTDPAGDVALTLARPE